MSYEKVCFFFGCALFACGSHQTGGAGIAGAASGGQISEGRDATAGDTATGGKTSGGAAGGKASGQAGETPSEGGKMSSEAGAGNEAGAGGATVSKPLDALSCATVPFGQGRPKAYRLSIVFGDGSSHAVTLTMGDAHRRPDTSDTKILQASVPVTQGGDEFAIALEGVSFSVERGKGPSGVFRGKLDIDGMAREITCWRADLKPEFRYDAATGDCKNAAGVEGSNAYPLELVRETKQGECVVFEKGDLNGDDFSYPNLSGWLLAGADLTQAGIHFANLVDADLRGTQMKGFKFGYAKVVGQIDAHSEPPQSSCKVEAMRFACSQ